MAAPVLTFTRTISNPWYNNGTLELSWTYDEEATSRCQLLTSIYLLAVNCSSRRVFFSDLQPGIYRLYIQAEDGAGNVAQEVVVQWTVGKLLITEKLLAALSYNHLIKNEYY